MKGGSKRSAREEMKGVDTGIWNKEKKLIDYNNNTSASFKFGLLQTQVPSQFSFGNSWPASNPGVLKIKKIELQ